MYDVASPESFEGLDVWLNELDTYATKKTLIKMLVANKIDKVSELIVERREKEGEKKERRGEEYVINYPLRRGLGLLYVSIDF